MKKIVTVFLLAFILSSCSLFRVHKSDVEQGNVLTNENAGRLHTGMTESEVKEVMGNPVLVNIFTPNRMDYVYTFKAGYGNMTEKRVTLIFVRGRVREIIRN